MEELIEVGAGDSVDRFFLADQALLNHLNCNANRSRSSSLTRSALEHEQLSVLNGELNVLHVLVVLLKLVHRIDELLVDSRILLFEFADRYGSSNTSDDVLALCVHQVFAKDFSSSDAWVAAESNASSAVVARVTVDHGLDVDGGADLIRDLLGSAIEDGSLVVPTAENGFDREGELLPRIGWELASGLLLDMIKEELADFLHMVGGQFEIVLNSNLALVSGKNVLVE